MTSHMLKVAYTRLGGPTLRVCSICGQEIRSRNFSARLPENQVLLCNSHLKSKLVTERMWGTIQ